MSSALCILTPRNDFNITSFCNLLVERFSGEFRQFAVIPDLSETEIKGEPRHAYITISSNDNFNEESIGLINAFISDMGITEFSIVN